MPETTAPLYINGFQNGYMECETGDETDAFLFTSESVGEGHPGKFIFFHSLLMLVMADIEAAYS